MDLDKELHVDPARILAVCQVFRDRRETPTRLVSAIDDPMPVETGDATVDGVTSTAMHRLTMRFDEFAETMRKDAAGLVWSLQRYRATEEATRRDLSELAHSLAERPGAVPPVSPVPGPDIPPAVPPQAVPRVRTWERVDPPAGAGCARRLGEPEGIRVLAQALHRAGSGMDELITMLRGQVNDLVPAGWNGEGATAFKQQIEQQLQIGSRVIVERARKVGDAAGKLADGLHAAWVKFAEAELLAIRFGLTISDTCRLVVPSGPDTPEKRAATERCLSLVDQAVMDAAAAQSGFRTALVETYDDHVAIWGPLLRDFLLSVTTGAPPGVRLPIRPRMPTGAGAPRAPVRPFQERLHSPAAQARQQQIIDDVAAGRLSPQAAGREYERLVAQDLRATDGQNRFGQPGRRWDVGSRHEITLEGMTGGFSTHKLNQFWFDFTRNGEVLLTVPRLSVQARDELARLLAQARTVRPDASLYVRETLP